MARYKWIMQNIRVLQHAYTLAIHWETDEGRFHVFLNGDQPRDTIYKNSLADHNQPGYFHTRRLDGTKKANAWIIEEIMRAVRDGDMINKAKAEYDAKQAAERKANEERAQLIHDANDLFNSFKLILSGDALSYTLTRDDMLALLEYVPKDRDHG